MTHLKHIFTGLLLLCATAVAAHDFAVNGIYYNITDATNKTVEVTYMGSSSSSVYDEYTGSVVIPKNVAYNGTTYSVTTIGSWAFYYCSILTNITIPNSVTTIGEYAFYYCSSLTSITIPNSVTTIGNYAFYKCSSLTSITIPNSVTTIGEDAFYDCTGLKSATIGNSVTTIGNYAFYGCSSLTSITIPNSVTTIGSGAFRGCSSLKSATIGNSVTTIGGSAFEGCAGLNAIHISNIAAWCNISFTGYLANPLYYAKTLYLNGNLLTELTVPDEITQIKNYAFYNCKELKGVTICDGVKSIGAYAFNGCNNMETLYISSTIEGVGNYAFAECNNIMDIKIGSKKAITASENVFSNDAYANACLYVPTGRKFAYEKATPWNNFYVVEMDFTGIDEVFDDVKEEPAVDASQNVKMQTIYDLNGRAVENPSNGIYIVNGKKMLIK